MNMRYRRLTSPEMKVQGNPIRAATGAASAQKPSIAMVRIILSVPLFSAPLGASLSLLRVCLLWDLRLAFQPRGAAGPLFGGNILRVFEVVGDFLAASHLPLQLALPTSPRTNLHGDRVARSQQRNLLRGLLSRRRSINFQDNIAGLQTSPLSLAARRH